MRAAVQCGLVRKKKKQQQENNKQIKTNIQIKNKSLDVIYNNNKTRACTLMTVRSLRTMTSF